MIASAASRLQVTAAHRVDRKELEDAIRSIRVPLVPPQHHHLPLSPADLLTPIGPGGRWTNPDTGSDG